MASSAPDAQALIDAELERAPLPADEELAFFHAYARPTEPDDGLLELAIANAGRIEDFSNRLVAAIANVDIRTQVHPQLTGHGGWALTTQGRTQESLEPPSAALSTSLDFDGYCHLFSVAGRKGWIGELIIGVNLGSFFALAGELYSLGGYSGEVDIGVATSGLQGKTSDSARYTGSNREPYSDPEYRRAEQVTALELQNHPDDVARRLLARLIDPLVHPGFDSLRPLRSITAKQH
jgi:hypothetical protein